MKATLSNAMALILAIGILILLAPGFTAAEIAAIKAAGCKTEYFLLKDLVSGYSAATGNKLQVGSTGNKKAVDLLLEERIEFTFTCKPINKLTQGFKLEPDAVSSWKSVAIAKDPIIVVAHEKNGVDGVTSDQLTKLFTGEITNWKELGGNDIPVKTAHMSPRLESGVVLLFKEFTVGSKGQLDKDAMVANGPSMLGNFTSVTPGAVTFMGYNSYKYKYGKILKIDDVSPSRETILDDTYKLAATYYLTLDGRDNAAVASFVDYVGSEDGKRIIDQNFISYSK